MSGRAYQLTCRAAAVCFPANSNHPVVAGAGTIRGEPGANRSSQHLNEALSLVSWYQFLFQHVRFAGSQPDLSASAGRCTCPGSGRLCSLSLCQVPSEHVCLLLNKTSIKTVDSFVQDELLPGQLHTNKEKPGAFL